MHRQPAISVIIPARNAAATIGACLGSVLGQTAPPLEALVVDDASTDSTADMVRETASGAPIPVRLLELPANRGPAAARNLGWNNAAGEVVAFLDADDLWHRRKLELAGRVLAANPGIDVLGHPYRAGAGQDLDWPLPRRVRLGPVPLASLLLRNVAATSCCLARTALAERFDEAMRHCEDHDLWARLALGHAVFHMDLPLTLMRRPQRSPGGLSGSTLRMRLGEMRIYGHVARRRPLLWPAVPALLLFSTGKHLAKFLAARSD
jgi:glycosyltransferase involved in cell wall biosynthesis